MATLRHFRRLRKAALWLRREYLRRRFGIAIHTTSSVSLSAKFRPAGRGTIHVGTHTLIAFNTLVLAKKDKVTRIGDNCFIGGGAMILPGVSIGDNSIVGAGAVVFENVPPRSLVVGNPARIVRGGLFTGAYGRMSEADSNTQALYRPGAVDG